MGPKRREGMFMARKIKIRIVSKWSTIITIVLFITSIGMAVWGHQQYKVLRSSMQDYIDCRYAVQELAQGSNILTKQVRLAASTGDRKYIAAYFEEANVTKTREKALQDLSKLDDNAESLHSLREALSTSRNLMNLEYYAMRLIEESKGADISTWPEEIRKVKLEPGDESLSPAEKMAKARNIVISPAYEKAKSEISTQVEESASAFSDMIYERQNRASEVFTHIFWVILTGMLAFAMMMLSLCLIMRHWIVKPLLRYNQNIEQDQLLDVDGAYELEKLGKTYNRIYKQNEERQKLIKHQAEHDALTDLLNRGSYNRIFSLYEKDKKDFALILIDVDIFKAVNDNNGHAVGDEILKKVSRLLLETFRDIDYICRIGGDEFAVIMVEMTSDLSYTVVDRINAINETLSNPTDGLPAVSLSVGVAFTDRKNPGKSQFTDADQALYYTKEHGKHGLTFYPAPKD